MNSPFGVKSLAMASCQIFPENNLRSIKSRLIFVIKGIYYRSQIVRALELNSRRVLFLHIKDNPMFLGFLVWPYLNSKNVVTTRFTLVAKHQEILATRFPWLQMPMYQQQTVASLTHLHEGLYFAIEHAPWFIREGGLNFSLFLDATRLMSISFSFDTADTGLFVYVGALQGSATTSQETYKAIADGCCDLRPRDLTFKAFRIFLQSIGVTHLRCIADDHRVMHHKFFKAQKAELVAMRYDELWAEQGGVLSPDGYFEITAFMPERPIAEVPQKKRGRYKRRLEMFEVLRLQMQR
jgi:uncharacterized protein VirK/YbjX